MLVAIHTHSELPRMLENPEVIAIKSSASFYVRGTEVAVKRLVTDLEKHTSLSGRNISYDRL